MEEERVVMTIRERDLVLVSVQSEDAEEQHDQETPLTPENEAAEDHHGDRMSWTRDDVAVDNQHETQQTSVTNDNKAAEHHHEDRVWLDEVRTPAEDATAEHRQEDMDRESETHITIGDMAAERPEQDGHQHDGHQHDEEPDIPESVDSEVAEDQTNTRPWTIEGVTAELLSLYRFLIRTYLPEHTLRIPPPEGWPQINKEDFAPLQKDDIVIELLKYLPYIRSDGAEDNMIWTDSTCNDYAGLRMLSYVYSAEMIMIEGLLTPGDDDPYDEPVGSHRVVLWGHKSRDGICVVFNTEDGTVLNANPMYGNDEEFDNMAEFVKHVKQNFIDMDIFAVNETELEEKEMKPEERTAVFQALLVKHGWPGDNFAKAAYLKDAIKADHMLWDGSEPDEADPAERDEGLPYSVRHVADMLLSLYQFLVHMYLPEDMLRVPSLNGWDHVYHNLWIPMHKTSRVGNLMKHLPYIRQDLQDVKPSMMSMDSVCVDYSGQLIARDVYSTHRWHAKGLPQSQTEHLLVLATDSSKSTSSIIFDTLTGKVERFKANQRLQIFESIDDLVQCLKQEFTDLQVCPVDSMNVEQDSTTAELNKYRSIFRKHGWPGEHYAKEYCLAELQAVRRESTKR